MLFCVALSPPAKRAINSLTEIIPFLPDNFTLFTQEKRESDQLFQSVDSIGVIAIGHAEGNLTVTGEKTSLYWGHQDPGNFKRNQGWCSDQGRGGGDPNLADRKCLERVKNRLPTIYQDLEKAGINADENIAVFVNAVDLYNQASPWVSRQFPAKYALAQQKGKEGEIALVWARVEAFRRRGKIDASGLIGICRRENRPVSDWDCVAGDQRRRIRAIARVLDRHQPPPPQQYIPPTQGKMTQGFSPTHPGIDIANAPGTLIVAAASGTVTVAGWDDWGLGNVVKIQHPDGSETIYGHNRRILVETGQKVLQGQIIAEMGNTGNSNGSHLHFEIRMEGEAIDLTPLLKQEMN